MKHTDKVKGLKAKARALEDSFFARENERVLEELRAAAKKEETKREFRESLKIENDEVLDALIDLEVAPETVLAFSLVPLVEVAWADGEIQDRERKAILDAAIEKGLEANSPTCVLLDNWLHTKPDQVLYETWRSYIDELMETLGDDARTQMKTSVIGRARAVAEAAGGFLGVGSISAAEQKMLAELEQAFV